jgi:hypothetical protein
VIPKLGLYANFVAQVVSQISSHFIIHYDRKVVREGKRRLHEHDAGPSGVLVEATSSGQYFPRQSGATTLTTSESLPTTCQAEESLASHAFTRPHRGEADTLIPRLFVTPSVFCGGAALAVFLVMGCAMHSFSSEVLGIFGLVVESGNGFEEDAISEHSLFSMVKVLFKQAEFRGTAGDYVGLGSLGALLIATVLIIPLLQGALLLYHWSRPMSRNQRKRVMLASEVLQAWQYTEVFALSVVAGAW